MVQFLRVDVKGTRGTFLYLKRVRSRTKAESIRLTKRLAMAIRRRAKLLVAPLSTGTGELRNSIVTRRIKNGWQVTAGNERTVNRRGQNYAVFQELGFSPHRVFVGSLNPNSKLAKDLRSLGAKSAVVERWTPFMTPAFNHAVRRLPNEMLNTANRITRR